MKIILINIILPLAIIVYYERNKEEKQKGYQLVKSIWYFYSAVVLILNYFGEKSVTQDDLTGFAIALALFEGVPGFWELIQWKIKVLIGGSILKFV